MIKLVERSLGAGPKIIKEIKPENIFAECFQVEKRMHESMMSVVFRAHDMSASRWVVLKMTDNTDHRRFYDAEAKILGDKLHPAFSELYERWRAGNIDYNSLEYIAGSTLLERNLAQFRHLCPWPGLLFHTDRFSAGFVPARYAGGA